MLTAQKLSGYVAAQLTHFFPDGLTKGRELNRLVNVALQRSDHCFSQIKAKYYNEARGSLNHLHTDQYASFLYFLGNFAFKENRPLLASKIFALNKALHALDIFYEVELPEVFYLEHPVGTVLGRAKYGNYFMVHQSCTVGSNVEDVYPILGEGVVMYAGSGIIGKSKLGNNCWLAYGAVLKNENVPANSIVFERSPKAVIKRTKRSVIRDLFGLKDFH